MVINDAIPMNGNREKVKLNKSSNTRGISVLELIPGSWKKTNIRTHEHIDSIIMQ